LCAGRTGESLCRMDRLRILAETRGFFTRADAFGEGHDDKTIRRALKTRVWTRVRPGSYTYTDLWSDVDDRRRHLVTAHAVTHRLGPVVALSHTSAAVDHDLTLWEPELSLVHVTRLDGTAGRTEAGVQHHEGLCLHDDVEEKYGHLVVKPVRAALEAGSLMSTEGAVVVLDSLLHKGYRREDLEAGFAQMQYWPFWRGLQVAVRLADGRSESVGESRSRYLCYAQSLPMPELQFEVRDHSGALLGITDLAWPEHRLLGEFDGKIKYGRLLREGEQAGDAVFREKLREDALREATGWSMVRLVWADLYRPAATAARIRRMLGLSAA
jgi:hypothetical protein